MSLFVRFFAGLICLIGGVGCIYAGVQPENSGSSLALIIIGLVLLAVTIACWGIWEFAIAALNALNDWL